MLTADIPLERLLEPVNKLLDQAETLPAKADVPRLCQACRQLIGWVLEQQEWITKGKHAHDRAVELGRKGGLVKARRSKLAKRAHSAAG